MGKSWVYKYQVGRDYTIKGKKFHVIAEGTWDKKLKGAYAKMRQIGKKKVIKIRNYPGYQYKF